MYVVVRVSIIRVRNVCWIFVFRLYKWVIFVSSLQHFTLQYGILHLGHLYLKNNRTGWHHKKRHWIIVVICDTEYWQNDCCALFTSEKNPISRSIHRRSIFEIFRLIYALFPQITQLLWFDSRVPSRLFRLLSLALRVQSMNK